MEAGRVIKARTVDGVFDNAQCPYTRRLLAAIPRLPGR
jgi:ABC-type dipeptide/oligopeptide/nickel transport system ATPase component